MSDYIGKNDIINNDEIDKAAKAAAKSLEPLKVGITEIITLSKAINKSFGKLDFSGAVKANKSVENSVRELSNIEKERIKVKNKLHEVLSKNLIAEEKSPSILIKGTEALKRKNAALKEEEKLKTRLVQTNAKLNIARSQEARQLALSQEKIRQIRAEHNKLAKEQLGVKNNSNGIVSAFKNLAKAAISYFVAIASVQRIMNFFTRDLLELNKKIDSQAFAMKTVIKDTSEYNQTVVFLSETAKNYGQDILVLTERYIKFRAATIQSNMSAEQTQKIFDSTARAAAVLGLKTDEVNGVFLALEQMISKGKVTTEELRRQLGERLPGAMGVMARAIGVTVGELDTMMKRGEVYSDYALPRFAKALEEAYGLEAVKKVDTLASAQGRLNTAWLELVKSLNTSSAYTSTLNFIAGIISKIHYDIMGVAEIQRGMSVHMVSSVLKNMSEMETKEKRMEYLTNEILKLQKEQDYYRQKAIHHSKELNSLDSKIAKTLSTLTTGSEMRLQNMLNVVFGYQGALLEHTKDLEYYNNILIGSSNAVDELSKKLREIADMRDPIKVFDLDELLENTKKAEQAYEDFTKVADSELTDLTKKDKYYLLESGENFKEYVNNKLIDLKRQLDEAEKLYAREQAMLDWVAVNDKKRLNEQDARATAANDHRQRLSEGYFKLQLMLYEKEKDFDNELQMQKLKNEIQLIQLKRQLKERWLAFVEETNANELLSEKEKSDKIKEFESEQTIFLIAAQQTLNNELIPTINKISEKKKKAAKGDSKEIIKIEKETAQALEDIHKDSLEFERQMEEEAANEKVDNTARDIEKEKEKLKALSDATVDYYYNLADEEVAANQDAALKRIETEKLKNKKIEQLQRELRTQEAYIEMKAVRSMIESSDLTLEEKEKKLKELAQLEKRYKDILIENSKKDLADDLEEWKKWASAVAEIYNSLFQVVGAMLERQMQDAEKMYKNDQKYAGASVEAKIEAEKKYEQKRIKIQKKQALAQKLQSAFNVTMQMIEAAPKAASLDPLAIAQLIAGGISLAAIAAEPLPSFQEGGSHKGGAARVSEEGEELFIAKNKKMYLTPKKETIANFPAGEFIPHDETQRMLAQYAMNQRHDIVDMSMTNKHLKNIERNTKYPDTINYIGGYKVIRRNGLTSKVKIR